MSDEVESKPDFVFHYPAKLKMTKQLHAEFNAELNRTTKLILNSALATQRADLAEKVRGLERYVYCNGGVVTLDEEGKFLSLSKVLALIEGEK